MILYAVRSLIVISRLRIANKVGYLIDIIATSLQHLPSFYPGPDELK